MQHTTIHPPPTLRGPLTDAERDVLSGYIKRMEAIEQRSIMYVSIGLILHIGIATGFVTFILNIGG